MTASPLAPPLLDRERTGMNGNEYRPGPGWLQLGCCMP